MVMCSDSKTLRVGLSRAVYVTEARVHPVSVLLNRFDLRGESVAARFTHH